MEKYSKRWKAIVVYLWRIYRLEIYATEAGETETEKENTKRKKTKRKTGLYRISGPDIILPTGKQPHSSEYEKPQPALLPQQTTTKTSGEKIAKKAKTRIIKTRRN
jgi:hypothetical protein